MEKKTVSLTSDSTHATISCERRLGPMWSERSGAAAAGLRGQEPAFSC